MELRISDPAELLAGLPYLLGFHPGESVILVGYGGARPRGERLLRCGLRVDLPPPGSVSKVADALTAKTASQGCAAVSLVVIGGATPGEDERLPCRELVATLVEACATHGCSVLDAVWVGELVEGASWRCYGPCGCAGLLPDPASTAMAAAAVYAGQITYADRAEVERLVAPTDPVVLRRRSRLLAHRRDPTGGAGGQGRRASRAGVELVTQWVHTAAGDQLSALGDDDVVALCLALRDPLVRDVAAGFALGDHALGARRLWSALVTQTPDPDSAEPATLLACSALCEGNGTLANIALDRAQRANPGHRLSAMLREALDAGLDPDTIQGFLAEGTQQAAALLTQQDSES